MPLREKLERAYVIDSTHWEILEEPSWQRQEESRALNRILQDGDSSSADNVYWYIIYPDSTSVDRSRGMCDRMVEGADGTLVADWDGTFISVEVQRDTVWIREGWLR